MVYDYGDLCQVLTRRRGDNVFYLTPPYSEIDENSNQQLPAISEIMEGSLNDKEEVSRKSLISSEGYYSSEEIDHNTTYNILTHQVTQAILPPNRKGKRAVKAPLDSVLLNPQILVNLLKSQDWYLPPYQYLKDNPENKMKSLGQGGLQQSEITGDMRKILATWMFEVCQECRCGKDVFLFAINLMDRFLCKVDLKKSHYQLIGSVAIFIASKFKEACPLSASTICAYTDNSFNVKELLEWEFFFSNILEWDFGYITPLSFVDTIYHTLTYGPVRDEMLGIMKDNTMELLALCAIDENFMRERPSDMIAACSYVAYEFFERDDPKYEMTLSYLFHHLSSTIRINPCSFTSLILRINKAFQGYLKKVEQKNRCS